MKKKRLIILSFILLSVVGYSQLSVSFSELYKDKRGKYILKSTGELYSGEAFGKYENGQVGMQGQIKNGFFDGLWVWWYEDGTKKRETTYKEGVKDGYSYWWYKNGIKKSEIKFSNNHNVEQKRWDEEGNRLPNPKMGRR